MTIVYNRVMVEIRGDQSRQLSPQEAYSIMKGVNKMFGMVPENTQTFQNYLDRYCQHTGKRRLLITDIIL